jgi:hypothetical protein
MDAALTRREWLLLGLGAVALFVLTYLTEPGIFGSIDWVRIHVFYKGYLAQAVRAGRLPLWNPHVALGRPFLADVDAALFYPPNVFYLLLPAELACAVVTTLHLGLGLYGMCRFTRALGADRAGSLAAAFVFVSGAAVVGCFTSGLIHYGAALCYLPLVLFLMVRLQERRSLKLIAALAVVLGMQLMGGHPQASWLTGFGAAVFALGRRLERPFGRALVGAGLDLACLAGAAIWAIGLAGVTVLPLAEMLAQSNRGAPSLAFAGSFAMPWFGWATLVVPTSDTFQLLANAQLYAGIVPLLAGLGGLLLVRDRNARALALLVLVAAVLAAGNATAIFAGMYHLVPGLATMRIPSRASILIALGLAAAAGLFVSAPRRPLIVVGLGALASIAALAFTLSWPGLGGTALVRAALIAVGAGLLVLWQRGRRPAIGAAMLLLTAGDLAFATAALKRQNRDDPERPGETAVHQILAGQGLLKGAPPRVSVPKPYARENAGMQEGWSSFTVYASLNLGRVWTYLHAGLGLPVPLEQNTYPASEIFRRGVFPYDSMNLVFGLDPVSRQGRLRPHPDPRAYLTYAAETVPDWPRAVVRMREGHDFHRVALVETPVSLPATAAETGPAEIVAFAPEAVTVATHGTSAALLVLAEAWYPGWTASVDGAAVPCLPANAWMRAALVPAGEHQVTFRFHSTRLRVGALLSLATLALALAALLLEGRLPRRRRVI